MVVVSHYLIEIYSFWINMFNGFSFFLLSKSHQEKDEETNELNCIFAFILPSSSSSFCCVHQSVCVCFYFNLINFSFLHSHAYSISIRSVLSFSGLQCCNRINVAFHRFAWGDRSTTKHHHSKSQMFAIFLLHFSSPFWFW